MHKNCFICDSKQVDKVSELLNLEWGSIKRLKRKVQNYLEQCDMTKTNPEIMQGVWQIIIQQTGIDDPYQKVKQHFNQQFLKMLSQFETVIHNDLMTALKMSIIANLIDYSSFDEIDEAAIARKMLATSTVSLEIDDSAELLKALHNCRTLLYLGDNCGEIVLDKLFIKVIKEKYPKMQVYYGVRGKPIVNDVTMQDADEVAMAEVARVISNGDGSLGTVLENTSPTFQTLFRQADVVISKGQGNYEGLYREHKDHLFFLFMVKCPLVREWSGCENNAIVCLKNNKKEPDHV